MLALESDFATLEEPSMADLARPRTKQTIVRLDYDEQGLIVQWDDGRRSRFPATWLRDNCACPQCRHPKALERTFMFVDHPPPAIVSATVGSDQVMDVAF